MLDNLTKSDAVAFSLALNGYGGGYEDCLESQKIYARRVGIDLVQFRSSVSCSAAFCAWLKIPLLIELFNVGYTKVLYLDADCAVRENAPRFTEVMVPEASLFMARGWSGRLNSGVIMAFGSEAARCALAAIVDDCENPVPDESRAQYENGHVIRWLSDSPTLKVLGNEWNSIQHHSEADYVWHFTGPNSRSRSCDVSKLSLGVKILRIVKRRVHSVMAVPSVDVTPRKLRATARYLIEKQGVLRRKAQ